jgi:hypothetical protein
MVDSGGGELCIIVGLLEKKWSRTVPDTFIPQGSCENGS